MVTNWTDPQRRAMNHRCGEAIVSASAGSGKTAVLIERALGIVRSRSARVDQLLIVTFTDDAAEQLRARLRSGLEAAYRGAGKGDDREYLLGQLRLLDRAQIGTIHGFARQILREYHHLSGLDADVSVLSSEQSQLLRARVADELLESCYAADGQFGESFRLLVDLYGGRSVDGGLTGTLLHIHAFLASLVDPDDWLARGRALYAAINDKDTDFELLVHPIGQCLCTEWRAAFRQFSERFASLGLVADELGITSMAKHLCELTMLAEKVAEAIDTGRVDTIVKCVPDNIDRSPAIRDKSDEAQRLREDLKQCKEDFKEHITEIRELLSDEAFERMRSQGPLVDVLLGLVSQFSTRLTAAKTELGQLDFDDLQRQALKTLGLPEGNDQANQTVADAYRRRFEYVMVDEYQDVNELQDAIVRAVCRESSNGRADKDKDKDNLLVVGDVKQSIYRFRLAEPKIFQDLSRQGGVERIDLRENFRSGKNVIDAVNALFEKLLVGGPTELEYDEQSKLVFAAGDANDTADQAYQTELLVIERQFAGETDSEFAELEAVDREAYLVAKRIKRLLESALTIPGDDGPRPVRQDDIVILMRSLKFTARKFIAMLRRVGLDAHCGQVDAFLEFPEIADIVALLQIVGNPYQDIPLAAVLRSSMVGISADDLARVRLASPGPFYRALRIFEQGGGQDDPTWEKVSRFCRLLDTLRRLAGELSVGELVQQMYHRTGYRYLAAVSSAGEHGRQNLEQFLDLAHQFGRDRQGDLQDFLDFLELLRERGQSISSVNAGSGTGVRIMSIHASKGLEFPVVILATLGKEVNLTDARGNILIDRELTIALKAPDREGAGKVDTAATAAISKTMRQKTIAEELRLLYVAMTRAETKLILTAGAEMDKLARIVEQVTGGGEIAGSRIVGHTRAIWWLAIALAEYDTNGQFARLAGLDTHGKVSIGPVLVETYPSAIQEKWQVPKLTGSVELTEAGRRIVAAADNGEPLSNVAPDPSAAEIIRRLDWRYPYRKYSEMPAVFPVTELTRLRQGVSDEPAPAEFGDTRLAGDAERFEQLGVQLSSAQVRGLAWHRFMEYVDLDRPAERETFEEQLGEMVEKGVLDADQAEMIDPDSICRFFRTTPGRIMLDNRDAIYRELAFTYAMSADDLPDELSPGPTDEKVLIRGVVDCLVKTRQGLVIIDYKTNQITSGQVDEKTTHYRGQLQMYSKALYEIVQLQVASAWIYFTQPDTAVQVV